MKKLISVFLLLSVSIPLSAAPKVVFLTGDEEYRSEESMPMIGKILRRDFGFDVEVGFSLNDKGVVDPEAAGSLTKMSELADADMLVLFLRFRRPAESDFEFFLDYLKAGKPVAAFRTATHSFRFAPGAGLDDWGYQADPKAKHDFAGGENLRKLVGQKWITHHGHFNDGRDPLTDVTILPAGEGHAILRGVKPFQAYSWLYHVQGGGDTVAGDPIFLLQGRALISAKEKRGQLDRYPIANPICWTKTHDWGAQPARVFSTTLGHPYDFRDPNMRRLAIQGILWAMGREDSIPRKGVKTKTVGKYAPNNSGFGPDKPKQNMRPEDFFPAE